MPMAMVMVMAMVTAMQNAWPAKRVLPHQGIEDFSLPSRESTKQHTKNILLLFIIKLEKYFYLRPCTRKFDIYFTLVSSHLILLNT